MDIETRIDNLDKKLDLRFDGLRAQFTALFANGPISRLDTRVTALESVPACPVQDHSVTLDRHTRSLDNISRAMWLIAGSVVVLLVKIGFDMLVHAGAVH